MRTLSALAIAALSITACGDSKSVLEPDQIPSMAVVDGAHHGGNPHFFFLEPMVPAPNATGTFDGTLAPTVEICVVVAEVCSGVLAAYTTASGPGAEAVRVDASNELYIVNWHTDQFTLDQSQHYRIRVLASGAEVGRADVDVVSAGGELKNVETGEYIPLLDGRTLPIKFRLEAGLVVAVTVSPNPAQVDVGRTAALEATLTDAHGNAVSGGPVVWTTSAPAIATVDGAGVVTGVGVGTVTVTASLGYASGSAQVEVTSAGLILSSISSGDWVTCGVNAAGEMYCWGAMNSSGALSTTTLHPQPFRFAPQITWKQVAVSSFNACGLSVEGVVYCWGNRNGAGGLGDGLFDGSRGDPQPILSELRFTYVTENGGPHCALAVEGTVWCWGTSAGATPRLAFGGIRMTALSGGDLNVCGISTEGVTHCFGFNYGPFGAAAIVPGGRIFRSLDLGGGPNCAFDPDGALWCWGYGGVGQLGTGSPLPGWNATPVPGGVGHTYVAVSVGLDHACGITADGEAWCWGDNTRGTLGDGTTTTALAPVRVATTARFSTIAVGQLQRACGITPSGEVYCWGANSWGQVGDGTTTDRYTPVRVLPPLGTP